MPFENPVSTTCPTKNNHLKVRSDTPPIVPTMSGLRIRLINKLNVLNSTTDPSSLSSSFTEMARILILYHNDMRSFRLENKQPYFHPCEDAQLNMLRLLCQIFSLHKYSYSKGKNANLFNYKVNQIK